MRAQIDRGLFLAIVFLMGLGLVQIYSSSYIFAIESFNDGLFFVKKQALFILIAIAILLIVAYLPWRILERLALVAWGLAGIGVMLTIVPHVGIRTGGASRWLPVPGGFHWQPSEFLKYGTPVAMAYLLTSSKKFVELRLRAILAWGLVALPVVLLLRQPDFGSFAIITVVVFCILFSRGLPLRYVVGGLATMAASFYFLIVRYRYRMARVLAFLNPWADPQHKGFQVIQSMLGFYSGGLTGVGLGRGQAKLFFLPEAHTDFTLSVLGEEQGFIGVVLVMLLLGYLVLRGMQISAQAKDERQKIIGLGVTITFAITALVNAGVAMGLLPTKGLGMPFLSYGGSQLIAISFALGILLNIDREGHEKALRSYIKV